MLISDPWALTSKCTVPNRLVKAATAEGLADPFNNPNGSLGFLYRQWATSGVGMLVTGNIHVDRRFPERPGSLVLDHLSDLGSYRTFVKTCKSGGSVVLAQLNHAGRQCPKIVSKRPISASSKRQPIFLGGYATSITASAHEIEDVIASFVRSTKLCFEVGFDGVQIHAAHGYLLSSFLSPRLNRRKDRWGGSIKNRARLLLTIVERIRCEMGKDFPIAIKLNATDFQRNGLEIEESLSVAQAAYCAGADLVEVSGGSYERLYIAGEFPGSELANQWQHQEAYFLDYALELRKRSQRPIMLTGGFGSRTSMDRAIGKGGIDAIGIARPMCVQPNIARALLSGSILNISDLDSPPPLWRGLLGPSGPIRRARLLNAIAAQCWYCIQIEKLAGIAPSDWEPSGYQAFKHILSTDQAKARMRLVPRPQAISAALSSGAASLGAS